MTTLRLFAIEARHNAALLLVPVILLFAWYMLDSQLWEPYLWSSTNELLRKSVAPLAAPAVAGAAAWMAGRDRRRGIGDLVATTARPALFRHLMLWLATTAWALLAYLLVAGYMFARTVPRATWGGPELWPVALAIVALLAHAAWGYLAGHLFASRFTAPIVAIVAFVAQMYLAGNMTVQTDGSQTSTWLARLAASDITERIAPWQTLFYAALALAGLAALWLTLRGGLLAGLLLAGTMSLAAGAVVMIWAGTPRWDYTHNRLVDGWGNTIAIAEYEAPEPVCRGEAVVVCTHPQFQPWLDDAVANAEALIAPLQGLPGVASPVECRSTGFGRGRSGGSHIVVDACADQLIADDGALSRFGQVRNEAQLAVRTWLLARVGSETMCGFSGDPDIGHPTAAACAAAERFGNLAEPERRAWLEEHYADLRAGQLTLANLP